MKDKIYSIVRHLLTGASAWAVNSEWLSAEDASAATNAIAMLLAIILTRLILFGAAKVKWADIGKFLGGNKSQVIIVALATSTALGCVCLTSCNHSNTLGNISRSIPIQGRVHYNIGDNGAKAGVAFNPGQVPSGFFRYPFYDDQGNLLGLLDLETKVEDDVLPPYLPVTPVK